MSLIIGGIEPFTTVDFPQRLSAVLFCKGCPWRCVYCHNPELQKFSKKSDISWETVLEFLNTRKGLLDGIVISGGEPLSQPALFEAMTEIKSLGFAVGLHTSGSDLKALERVIPLLDWVGFDAKVPFELYQERIAGSQGEVVSKSLQALVGAHVPLEVRTTLDPRLISQDELLRLASQVADVGVKSYALQEYRVHSTHQNIPSNTDIGAVFQNQELLEKLRSLFSDLILRRA